MLGQQAAQTLLDIRKAGDARLHDETVLFLRALALEAGAAATAGRRLPGARLTDGRYAVDIRRAAVLVYYVPDPDARVLRVSELIWVAV